MKPRSFNAVLLAASLAFAGLQGCAARLEMGVPPRLDRLAQLTPHVSTRNDVLLTLGEPRGHGAAHLDPGFKQQHVWLYEHSVSEGKDIQLTMLLIFFSGESFDGFMWFADTLNLKQYSAGKGK